MTAAEWREKNPKLKGNIRDYADIIHLVVLSNLEMVNSTMIEEGKYQRERLEKLNEIDRKQLILLLKDNGIKCLEEIDNNLIK